MVAPGIAPRPITMRRHATPSRCERHLPVVNVATGVGLLLGGEVGAPRGPRDLGPAHGLDGGDAGEGPEVGVRDPLVGGLDGLEERAGVVEAGVGAVRGLGLAEHGPRGLSRPRELTSGAKRIPALESAWVGGNEGRRTRWSRRCQA